MKAVLGALGALLLSSCAPALTRVPDRHPARPTAEVTPLPDVALMITGDDDAPPPPPPTSGHHHHHGGAHE